VVAASGEPGIQAWLSSTSLNRLFLALVWAGAATQSLFFHRDALLSFSLPVNEDHTSSGTTFIFLLDWFDAEVFFS
jgi:hypothetical protein